MLMATTTFTKKSLGLESTEPAVTPPSTKGAQANFAKKPKLGAGKSKKRDIPEGLWTKCPKCETMVFDKELDENLKVCPKCESSFSHRLARTHSFAGRDLHVRGDGRGHDERGSAHVRGQNLLSQASSGPSGSNRR